MCALGMARVFLPLPFEQVVDDAVSGVTIDHVYLAELAKDLEAVNKLAGQKAVSDEHDDDMSLRSSPNSSARPTAVLSL
ncbi:hypothetical protein C4K68_22515 [Pokkaliibacter plantistimulans]|uniref:Uncharacterized protein n=1 Tax=Proteobacteria bacterium 228 TaxID=2083153 RepID=A0A2S5KL73_9PROT|nr:hypothetical protein C4K68_22515 [Pokkaliibacter plantistimulans]